LGKSDSILVIIATQGRAATYITTSVRAIGACYGVGGVRRTNGARLINGKTNFHGFGLIFAWWLRSHLMNVEV
jgi:hypothetical protein